VTDYEIGREISVLYEKHGDPGIAFPAMARRARELCGPTAAERELIEAALALIPPMERMTKSGVQAGYPVILNEFDIAAFHAAMRLRDERKPKLRYSVGSGRSGSMTIFWDEKNGCHLTVEQVVSRLNAAEPK
jgi:hypothetical protein